MPLFLAIVVGYLPVWRRGFATERTEPVPRRWFGWVWGLAAILAAAGVVGYVVRQRSTNADTLFTESFWSGLRDGLIILGIVFGVLAICLMVAARKIFMLAQGKKPYQRFETMGAGLWRTSKKEIAALRARLPDAAPGGRPWAQAAVCLEGAEAIVELIRRPGGTTDSLAYHELYVSVVLCRVGRTALETGMPIDGRAPFCWHNPLHGMAVGTWELQYLGEKRPRNPCASCLEGARSAAEPEERLLRIIKNRNLRPIYLEGGYFREGTGLDDLLDAVKERQRFVERMQRR